MAEEKKIKQSLENKCKWQPIYSKEKDGCGKCNGYNFGCYLYFPKIYNKGTKAAQIGAQNY